ncbi:GATA zinc finger domain-containing protein 14 [Cydia fagiglandana]|uniref:GATA zinc finger domain-containing protein 14 n=1 Tax=Cydia fagiglandana TaxID=1458189 RepID=UPI002FEE1119
MADYFFGFDTSSSNLNDDEGAGEPSEDEYDALNDETFGQADGFDFEEHEQMASQIESSRRHHSTLDDANLQLEASLSQLVLDESEHTSALGSSVWRHDAPFQYQPPQTQTPAPMLKNVCTVEEIERQLRQKQAPFPPTQNYYQPRFPPVILQRPPGLQAPVPLPFAPQNMPINNMMPMGHNHPNNMPNQMGQNVNQMGQNINQMGQNVNQMGQNVNQMGQNVNQFMQNANHYNNMQNNMHPNMHMNQMPNQVNMGPNMNMGQNQMMPNGNQFPGMNQPGMNQFPHMMPRMMPPPGMGMPRQNFNPNVGQFNHNFRGPAIPSKPEPMIQMHPQKTQPNQSPPKNGKTPPKLQKSRVYNNSKTAPANMASQNLTSQNLVQLIQNTHPMLQFNNSYHNASHHPMLNRGFGQFPNNMPYGQRPNGTFNNNHRHMNGDDVTVLSDTDEYSGLMTQREKQWLINIQMLQLNTGTPYIHDFYYTVFLERQSQKEKEGVKEAHKANQQNHPFYSGGVKQESHGRERHNSNRHNSTSEDAPPRAYVPTQFENSLGKLQCGSVTAPRKIIDVELVGGAEPSAVPSRANSVASTTNPAEVPREMRRTKQLLLDIEALYLILLRLEELNDPLAISNALILKEREEKQKQLEAAQKEALENELEEDSNVFLRNIESVQRRPKQDSPKSESVDKRQVVNLAVNQKSPPVKNLLDENKDELVDKMFAGLLHADRLAQMLTVRKGRALVARFLARLGAGAGQQARGRAVWARALRALPQAARRDGGGLAALAPHYRKYIQSATGWNPILESCGLLAEALDPARTPYALTTPLTLSCVCALIEKASLLVNTPEATSNERQWYKFLKTLARALKTTTLTVAKPVTPLPENKLLFHLKQLESRTTIEILQRGKSAEFADLSKADVTEQLIKHLC